MLACGGWRGLAALLRGGRHCSSDGVGKRSYAHQRCQPQVVSDTFAPLLSVRCQAGVALDIAHVFVRGEFVAVVVLYVVPIRLGCRGIWRRWRHSAANSASSIAPSLASGGHVLGRVGNRRRARHRASTADPAHVSYCRRHLGFDLVAFMRPSPGLLSGGYSDARGVHALVARTFRHILGAYALRFVFVRLCSVKHRRFVSPTRALALLCVAPALRHKRLCELSVMTQRFIELRTSFVVVCRMCACVCPVDSLARGHALKLVPALGVRAGCFVVLALACAHELR